ncbi:MAG: hypothetical protein ACP5HU_12740 [Phycisphaerae bacterium]
MSKEPIVGIFSIKTPKELLAKLEDDYRDCQRDWADERAAWNFFVTAYHLAEWVFVVQHPSNPEAVSKALKKLCDNDAYWAACRYFANSAKHHTLKKPSLQLADSTTTTYIQTLDGSRREFAVRINGTEYTTSQLATPIMDRARDRVASVTQ